MNMESPLDGMVDDDYLAVERRKRRRVIIAAVVAVLIVLIGLFVLRGRKTAAPPADLAPKVTVMIPGHHKVAGSVNASGIIGAKHDMPVGVVGEGGMVTQVLVNPGDWVKAGQTLAVVERSVQTQQAASAAAAVRSAVSDAELAQANLVRAQALVKNGFISKADIDAKVAARDQAVAKANVAKAQLGEQMARNARLVIRAPAGGLVLTRAVEPGQIVMSGQGILFRIAEDGNMEMQARVAEQDLASMHIGTLAQVTPIGSNQVLTGQIWQLSPVIDPTTRQGVARIALHYDTSLRPGGFASTTIASGNSDVPLLPESSVLSDDQGTYVLVINGKNAVERRPVKVGSVGGDGVTIASGLNGTERVVVSAGAFLSPGQTVIPQLEGKSR